MQNFVDIALLINTNEIPARPVDLPIFCQQTP